MFQTYVNYFEYQAAQHPAIQHSAERPVFEVVDFEEAWSDFRTKIKEKDYMMRLALPSGGLSGNSDETIDVMGGFLIAKYFKTRTGTSQDLITTLDDCMRVGIEIAEKIVADSKNGHPLWYWSANSPETLDLTFTPRVWTGDAAYAGWMFIFRFNTDWRNCSKHPTEPGWPDGGFTPY